MIPALIELANFAGQRWATWVLAGSLDAALLLAVLSLVWLAIRRRVAPQVGYVLFLLVPLKLVLPMVVTVPAAQARWTPSGLVAAWLAGPNRIEGPVVAIQREEASEIRPSERPTPEPEQVKSTDQPSPALTRARTEGKTVALPASVAPNPAGPRLSMAAIALLGWLAGVVLLTGRLMANEIRFRTRLGRLPRLDPARLPFGLDELRRLAGVVRPVRVVEDDAVASPAVWGIVHPTIVLPTGITSSLTAAQLRWVLLHELAHVHRLDLIVVAFQRCAAILHFFNPVVWVANRIIHQLREYACDDFAVTLGRSSALEAGEAFVGVLRHAGPRRRQLEGTLGIFGFDARTTCLHRVHRLLDADRPTRTALGLPSRLALMVLAACSLPQLRAAVEATPAEPPAPLQKAVSPAPVSSKIADVPPLTDGQDFELTVVGPGGKPVPGAIIGFGNNPSPTAEQVRRGKYLGMKRYWCEIQADDEGKLAVAFPRAPTGLIFHITIPGYGPYRADWSSSNPKDQIPSRFTAELEAGWSVGGVVVDPDGKPIPNATVDPWVDLKKRPGDFQQMRSGLRATTDDSGRWHCDSIPTSLGDVEVMINHPSYRPERRSLSRRVFGIERGAEPTAQLALPRGLTVVGKVVDEAGKPIVGALVRTKYETDVREAKTWSDGTYKLVGCEPIQTKIVVSSRGRAIDMKIVKVDSEMEPVDFIMKPGGTLKVRVLDHQGKPIPRARIYIQSWRGQRSYFEFDNMDRSADELGVWEWNEAPLDRIEASISPPGDSAMQLSDQALLAREEEYVFRLLPVLVVSGKAFDAETKDPINEYRVIPGLWSSETHIDWDQRASYQVTGGRYEVRRNYPFTAHVIRVEAKGYYPAVSRLIKNDEGTISVDLEVRRGRDVAAKIVTPDLKPAVGAKIALGVDGKQIGIEGGNIADGSTTSDRRIADDAGLFQFPPQSKKFQLIITHPSGYANFPSEAEWDTVKLIRLEPWARVEGTFRIGQKLGANVPLRLEAPGRPEASRLAHIYNQYEATTGPDGRFVFDRVIPGRGWVGRRIMLTVDDGAWDVTSANMVALDLPAGKTVTMDLGGTGRAVVGRLQPRDGFEGKVRWNFAMVTVNPDPPDRTAGSSYATVDRDGSFRIDDLPSGAYSLTVRSERNDVGILFQHPFRVPTPEDDPATTPLDLGTLKLEALVRRP